MRKLVWILLVLLLFTTTVYANSAEPPKLGIVVKHAPRDLVVELTGQKLQRMTRAWETYFFVYMRELPEERSAVRLEFVSQEKSFTLELPDSLFEEYNTKVTVDFRTETYKAGLSFWRNAALIALRMILTFLVEGLVFYLLGFQEKRSWLIFVMINLLTQGFLNLVLSGHLMSYSIYLGFVLAEVLIFAMEMLAFPLAVKEKKWWHSLLFAFVANLASLALGIQIIAYLPL